MKRQHALNNLDAETHRFKSECVKDPAVIARLPKSKWVVQWAWKAVRRFRDWLPTVHRIANSKIYSLGPLVVCRPMPWLMGPARVLHPEAFVTPNAEVSGGRSPSA